MSLNIHDYQQIATKGDLNALESQMKDGFTELHKAVREIKEQITAYSPQSMGRKARAFYSPQEFGNLLAISKNTVIRRCQDGTIRSTQPGGTGTAILIPCSELERIRSRAEQLE